MESKKWEALLAAVGAGSFSHAAEALGYTQSGLTHMMNSLEKDVGFSLLTRGHYGVRLTAAGQRLLPTIEQFTQSSSRLEREIATVSGTKAETIRVAAYASIAVHWLPLIACRFREEHPGVQVDIHLVNSAEELCTSLREDRADFGFGGCPKPKEFPNLHWMHLRADPLLAVLPADDPFGTEPSFPLAEFEGKEFLVSSQGFDSTILATMEQLGIHPNIRPSAMDDVTVISLVSHGLGVSMLTELVLRGNRETIRALPVQPAAFRQLGILSCPSRENSLHLRRFFSCAVKTVQELYRQKSEQYLE